MFIHEVVSCIFTCASRIDASKSTKGASKLRRDLINAEIANLRDLLPLPPSTRQRLSQLQLMALVCVFLRKANYFQQALKSAPGDSSNIPTPNIGFSKAMSGFIMMMTQQGKLLYISENAAEYLGHSMEDLLIHGDSVYDVIDKQDHAVVQNQLARSSPVPNDRRLFLCRINVSRNSRRQLRFGDQKVVLVEGHYLPFVPLCNRNESVFLASCTPVVLPETRESIVQGATNIFTTIHSMDMKYLHIDKTAESHLEYGRSELVGVSWYNLLHWDSIRTAYCKHQTVIQSDQERSSTALLRLQSRSGRWFWIHCVLQVKDTSEECQHPIIVCTNQVLSEREAEVMRSSSWLYQYSSQAKFTYGSCPAAGRSYTQESYPRTASIETDSSSSYGIDEIHSLTGSGTSSSSRRRVTREEAEPVDMSIGGGSGEHEAGGNSSSRPGSIGFQQEHRRKSQTGGYPTRGKLSQHLPGLQQLESAKYYPTIADLDESGGGGGYADVERRRLSLIAAAGKPPMTSGEPATESPVEHWGSSPVWSDTLQRVPDVVQQELGPYITTPTTPADTPDSELHSEAAPVFNFDWPGEQHVPNVKLPFRGANQDPRRQPPMQQHQQHQQQQQQHHQEVRPIALRLPSRRKTHVDTPKDVNPE